MPAPGGSGGASMPTPNRGNEAGAKQFMAIAVQLLEKALSLAGSDSEQGQAILSALKPLSKTIMPGDEQGQSMPAAMKSLMEGQAQQAPMIAALKARSAAPGGAPPQPQPMAA